MRSPSKDALGYLPAHFVPAIANIGILPVITRLLRPEHYRRYTLALATVSVLTVFSDWVNILTYRGSKVLSGTQR
jgi:O-antigen/teichoic acid export membrane protein